MDDKAKIGLAVAGGYVLGQSRKFKAVLRLPLLLGRRSLSTRPVMLARNGALKLTDSLQVGALHDRMAAPVAAGRRTVSAVAESRISRLANSVQDRTKKLSERTGMPGLADETKARAGDGRGGHTKGSRAADGQSRGGRRAKESATSTSKASASLRRKRTGKSSATPSEKRSAMTSRARSSSSGTSKKASGSGRSRGGSSGSESSERGGAS